MNKFIFKQPNRQNWPAIADNMLKAMSRAGKDFEVEVKELGKKRSGNQLKAFWVLIKVIKDWMWEQGNTYTAENISDWIKIRAGHCVEIDGDVFAKSIANKSDCTKEQMEVIIHTILQFGAENGIEGCEIEDRDLKELLEWYK